MARLTSRRPVLRVRDGVRVTRPDVLAAEEPLEIRISGTPLAVTMRTPGADWDLVHGFLATEGVIRGSGDIRTLRYCDSVDDTGRNTYNISDVELAEGVAPPDASVTRNFYTTSSCGICGKASIDAVTVASPYDLHADQTPVSLDVILRLPDKLREAQEVFDKTGGLHAAGIFSPAGRLLVAREDVGRHNAVDKAIGAMVREDRLPLIGCILMVSGRASFELTQKALLAGIPTLAAVSAPSSLAADLADEAGMTLIGFVRGSGCNVYTGQSRIS
ncbi:MAG: formate dehydrogenase accessory sulfurtransferase FdhD [Geodermatophilaceae bacterium]|jgi:FdhD protein|nr:formate dehydrogenase accessory sulfurtransferase FdhD [Geodermatophilaceae bacterium]